MYLYLSKPKLDALKQEWHGQSIAEWLQQFALSFKWSYADQSLEAKVGWKPKKDDLAVVKRIEQKIQKAGVEEFEDLLPEQNTGLFLFNGRALPQVALDTYLICMQAGRRGCLLAGSAHNAFGGIQDEPKESVSADPVRAIARLAPPAPDGSADSGLQRPVSRVFAEITAQTKGLSLPVLKGIAVYAGRVAALQSEINRVEGNSVEEIVIGSPVFVRSYK
jgi:hypothetical protein